MKRLSKKDTTMEMSQLIDRSFPYFSPYSMVKNADTPLVAATRSQPTNTNPQGRPPWQHFLLLPPPAASSGLGLRVRGSPLEVEDRWGSRRPFIPLTCRTAWL